jgi:hypothetical protein
MHSLEGLDLTVKYRTYRWDERSSMQYGKTRVTSVCENTPSCFGRFGEMSTVAETTPMGDVLNVDKNHVKGEREEERSDYLSKRVRYGRLRTPRRPRVKVDVVTFGGGKGVLWAEISCLGRFQLVPRLVPPLRYMYK